MKRNEKYPDTKSFHYFNANPKNRFTDDCWLRAICTGLNEPYNDVLKEMCEVHLKTGYELSSDKSIELYLKSKGWIKCSQPRKADNTKYTGKEYSALVKRIMMRTSDKQFNRIIANIGGHHMVAIIDGKINDIWDSTDGCIGNYYIKSYDLV